MKILLGDFNAKVGRVDVFKLTIINGSLHKISNNNEVNSSKFATFKNLSVKSTMFPHHIIHKHTWTFPAGKPYNQTDHILLGNRMYLMSNHSGQQTVILTTVLW
jgi:endonuclease/exonuclease/phosphatase family metal-dependent hydrolase